MASIPQCGSRFVPPYWLAVHPASFSRSTKNLPPGNHSRHLPVQIAFDSKALRTLCESELHASNQLGLEVARVLRHRLADLRAARSIDDVVVGNPRQFLSDRTRMMLDLCDGYVVVFCANHSQTAASLPDWPSVSRIRITEISSSNA
jgi:hypothetical protein